MTIENIQQKVALMIKTLLVSLGLSLCHAAIAAEVKIISAFPQQGSMIIGQLAGEGKVYFANIELATDQSGYFVFGVDRDAPDIVYLKVEDPQSRKIAINIQQRTWDIERVDGLPPGKINPRSAKVLARISQEAQLVKSARAENSDYDFFRMPFRLPAEGRISGVYGSQRVLNGQPKRPHYGLDVANKVGTPVIATASGKVSLVHADMFYSGGTLIIDHGHGISSTYIHLNTIDVVAGQTVKQGEVVATIGASGRATGPHLDWRVNWFNVRLDPQLLIENRVN